MLTFSVHETHFLIFTYTFADRSGVVVEHRTCDETSAGSNLNTSLKNLLFKKVTRLCISHCCFSVGAVLPCYCSGLAAVKGKIKNEDLRRYSSSVDLRTDGE